MSVACFDFPVSTVAAFGAVLSFVLAPALHAQHAEGMRTLTPAQAAQELAHYASCIVDRRGPQARAVALAPYLSEQQVKAAEKITVSVGDPCLQAGFDSISLAVRPDVLAGAVAEALLERDYPDLPTVIDRRAVDIEAERARAASLSVAERFGRCVVWSNPAGVQRLAATEPRSSAELQAMEALKQDMGMCLQEGSTLSLSRNFVRDVAVASAYRLAQQVRPRNGGK